MGFIVIKEVNTASCVTILFIFLNVNRNNMFLLTLQFINFQACNWKFFTQCCFRKATLFALFVYISSAAIWHITERFYLCYFVLCRVNFLCKSFSPHAFLTGNDRSGSGVMTNTAFHSCKCNHWLLVEHLQTDSECPLRCVQPFYITLYIHVIWTTFLTKKKLFKETVRYFVKLHLFCVWLYSTLLCTGENKLCANATTEWEDLLHFALASLTAEGSGAM